MTLRSGLLPLLLAALGVACGPTERPPNVVLVVLDTLRTDHLSAYGYPWPTSPRLQELAARGVLFEDCTAQASWTMPSMISLMTGRPIFTPIYRVPDAVPLLAERFQDAGWRTGAFIANALVSAHAGFDRGIEDFAAREKLTKTWSAEEVTDRGLRFLAADDERPFLLWLHYLDTHDPYTPPSTPWRRSTTELFDEEERQLVEQVLAGLPEDERRKLAFEREELAREVDRYDGAVAHLDAQIGRVFDALASSGRDGNTYVVVAADHGETLFRRAEGSRRLAKLRQHYDKQGGRIKLAEYLKKGHDGTPYQELVRTPLVIVGPGIPAGGRVHELVSNLDVAPTLLGLARLPVPPGLDGRDLSAALLAGTPPGPAPFAPTTSSAGHGLRLPDGRKIIRPIEGAPVVYDLVADPTERSPRPPTADEQELLERLDAMAAEGPFRAWSAREADPETLQALRELGYVR